MGRYDDPWQEAVLRILGEEREGEEWLKELDEIRSIRGGDGKGGKAMGEGEGRNK